MDDRLKVDSHNWGVISAVITLYPKQLGKSLFYLLGMLQESGAAVRQNE